MARYNTANKQKYLRGDIISRWHLRSVMEAVYSLVAQTNPRTVLDAGCGEGFVSKYLADRDPSLEILGVDVSPDAIRYAQENFGDAAGFQAGSILSLPFKDNSFDTVVCSEVLEHISELELAVTELKRVARTYVVISVPNEPYFKWINDFARAIRFSQDPGHVNFWTHSEFRAFIESRFFAPQFSRKHVIYQLAVAAVQNGAVVPANASIS